MYNHAKEMADRSAEDWIFGGTSQPGIVSVPFDEREQWLPQGELQNIGADKQDCATRASVNGAESVFSYFYNHSMHPDNKKWLENNGYVIFNGKIAFSDVYISILSGTTPTGNSLIAPLKAIRTYGLIPKAMLPQLNGTWEENADPSRITRQMRDLGAEFARRFTMCYERVPEILFRDALKDEQLSVAAFAWPAPINGVYPRVEGADPNHAFLLYSAGVCFNAFDNYIPFQKTLASNYDFYDTGYRFYIEKEDPEATVKLINLWTQLLARLTEILAIIKARVGAWIKS